VWPNVKSAPPHGGAVIPAFWLFIDANKVTANCASRQRCGRVPVQRQNNGRQLGGPRGWTTGGGARAYAYRCGEEHGTSFQLRTQ